MRTRTCVYVSVSVCVCVCVLTHRCTGVWMRDREYWFLFYDLFCFRKVCTHPLNSFYCVFLWAVELVAPHVYEERGAGE